MTSGRAWRCGAETAQPSSRQAAAPAPCDAHEQETKPYSLWWYVSCCVLVDGACGIIAFEQILGSAEGGAMSTAGPTQLLHRRLESRLRFGALLRGAAILTSVALAATVVLVLIAMPSPSPPSASPARASLLFIALAFALGFGLAIPLYGLDRRRAAGKAEEAFPQFQQRLVTFAERDQMATRDPFLELLAATR